jgi:hypothetical protein
VDETEATRRLEQLHRAMDAFHVIHPEGRPMAQDPWTVDLLHARPTEDWWNSCRVFRFGPLRFTVELKCSKDNRMSREEIYALADKITSRVALPPLAICGSHSPLSPRYPHHLSDVDLVAFIPFDDFFADIGKWRRLEIETGRIVDRCSEESGVRVSCGFLLDDFKRFPFMHDSVDIVPETAGIWDLSTEAVIEILEERWREFVADVDGARTYQRVIDAVVELIGSHRVHQVVTQARWEDVAWSLTRPTWVALIGEWFAGVP